MFHFWEKHPLGEFQKNLNTKTLKERPKKTLGFKKYEYKDFAKNTLLEGSQKNELEMIFGPPLNVFKFTFFGPHLEGVFAK